MARICFVLSFLLSPFWVTSQTESQRAVRTHDDTIRTLERGIVYRQALECQQEFIDSLRAVYEIRLWSYQEEVWFGLTDDQKRLVARLYSKSLEHLERKKKEFLDHEEYNRSIDPAMYDYMEYGFNLMKEFPSSSYFSLLRANNNALSFLDTFGFDPYFRLYDEFEQKMTTGLSRENCRAHMAIPFFHEYREEVQRIHRRRNALFYLVKDLPAPVDSVQEQKKINLPELADLALTDSPYTIADFIDQKRVEEFNLIPVELMDEPGLVTYTHPYTGNDIILMLGFLYQNTREQKFDLISDFVRNHEKEQLNEILLTDGKALFTTSRDEDPHTLKVTVMSDGILLIENEVLIFYFYRSSAYTSSVGELLSVIQLPGNKK